MRHTGFFLFPFVSSSAAFAPAMVFARVHAREKTVKRAAIASAAGILAMGCVHAAHPLITEDSGTQGRGKFQLELTYDDHHDRAQGIKTRSGVAASILTYGVTDDIDFALGLAHLRNETTGGGTSSLESGRGDGQLFVKWRFHENESVSFALKPSLNFPDGDSARGLGSGRRTYGLDFVASLNEERWTYHFHTGYLKNRNKVDEREDIIHLSAAAVYQATGKLKLIADAGMDTNRDKSSSSWPALLVTAVIYSPREWLNLDAGVHFGLNRAATDYALLAGITLRW